MSSEGLSVNSSHAFAQIDANIAQWEYVSNPDGTYSNLSASEEQEESIAAYAQDNTPAPGCYAVEDSEVDNDEEETQIDGDSKRS